MHTNTNNRELGLKASESSEYAETTRRNTARGRDAPAKSDKQTAKDDTSKAQQRRDQGTKECLVYVDGKFINQGLEV